MTKNFPGEKWKAVRLGFEHSNNLRFEVSDFGRVRSFHKNSEGKIINGSIINGYKIIRSKFLAIRDDVTQKKIDYFQNEVSKLRDRIRSMKKKGESKKAILEATQLLNLVIENLQKKSAADRKKRAIHYQALVHRLVAQHFLKTPSPDHTIVAHLDHDKFNNKATNLKWMTPEENYEHQRHSFFVINSRENLVERMRRSKTTKLSVTKVMLLKKLLNQGKPIRTLVKQFKVTDTQIIRIKRGENWADITAAN